jgi:alanine transaminase
MNSSFLQGASHPFKNVIKANIGDAHAMGQKPITFIRQVLACVSCPKLLESPDFPVDVKEHARTILEGCSGQSAGKLINLYENLFDSFRLLQPEHRS